MAATLIESTRDGGAESKELYGYEIWQITIPQGGTQSDIINIRGCPRWVYFFNSSTTTTGQIYVRMRHASTGVWFQRPLGGTATQYNLYGPYPVLGANQFRIISGSAESAERVIYVVFGYY